MNEEQDYSSIIEEAADSTSNLAGIRANDNPEQAARTKQLSDASGVPPMAVYADPKAFEERYKSQMASYVVRHNPELQDWIRKHPLAPSIANDDWGNLDNMVKRSRHTAEVWKDLQDNNWLSGDYQGSAVQEGIAAPWRAPLDQLRDDPFFAGMPRTANALQGFYTTGQLAGRALMSGIGGGLAAIAETHKMMYLDAMNTVAATGGDPKAVSRFLSGGTGGDPEMDAERFGRTMAGIKEMKLFQDSGRMPEWVERNRLIKDIEAFKQGPEKIKEGLSPEQQHFYQTPEGAAQFQRITRSYANTKQWLDHDLTPPAGVDELWDTIHTVRNASGVKQLNDDLATALQTATRERDPALFNKLLEPHYGNSSFGISLDFIKQLYGDTEPTPGDGLLGWIPDLPEKLRVARDTGDDVSVRVRDWLTHVDPKIAADATPFLRMVPEGITQAEAAVPREYVPTVDSALAQARNETALEPSFSIGDRKLTLSRREAPQPGEPQRQLPLGDWESLSAEERQAWVDHTADLEYTEGPIGTRHHFDLLDHRGNIVGDLKLTEIPQGLWMDSIGGKNGFSVHDFGPSLIQDLRRQLRAEFPQFIGKELGGFRVSGARGKFGTTGPVWIKFAEAPKGWDSVGGGENFRAILEGGEWQAYHQGVEAYFKAKSNPQVDAITNVIRDEFTKVTGGKSDIQFPEAIRATVAGKEREVRGVHLTDRDGRSTVLLAMELPPEARRGFMFHEGFHVLRKYGLITDAEWKVLRQTADERGWLKQYVGDRWDWLSQDKKYEEAAAEALRDHVNGKDLGLTPEAKTIFDKLKAFLDRIRQRINRLLGRPGTAEDIFERIESGEVGARAGVAEAGEPTFSTKLRDTIPEQIPHSPREAELTQSTSRALDEAIRAVRAKGEKLDPWQESAAELEQLSDATKAELTEQAALADQRNRQQMDVNYKHLLSILPEGYTAVRKVYKEQTAIPEWDRIFPTNTYKLEVHDKDGKLVGAINNVLYAQDISSGWFKKFLEEGGAKPAHTRAMEAARAAGGVPEGVTDLNFERFKQQYGGMEEDLSPTKEPGKVIPFGEPQFAIGPDRPPYLDVLDKIKADANGLPKETFDRLQDALAQKFAADVKAAEARITREKAKEATRAYRDARSAVKTEIERQIRGRPDVAADLYFSAGDHFGKKADQIVRIASDSLSDAQKEALPQNYYAKVGLPADTLATHFGFTSGDAMVNALAKLNEARGERKESALERTGRMVRDETDAKMAREYGDPQDNLMAQAREQAVSETDYNVLAEEYYAWAAAAKQPIVIDKLAADEIAKEALGKLPIGEISIARLRNRMKQAGDAAFTALEKKDYAGAMVAKQNQLLAGAYVRRAAELEVTMPRFDKMMQQLRRKDQPSLEPQYRNLIHLFQQKIGVSVARLPANIMEDITARNKGGTIPDYLIGEAQMGRINEVPDFILDPNWKKNVEEMTLDEFRKVNKAFTQLRANGRNHLVIKVGDETLDRTATIGDIINNMRELFQGKAAEPLPDTGLAHHFRTHYAGLIKLEALFNRLDHYQPMGPLQQVLRGVIESSNREDLEAKRYAKIFREEIGRLPNLDKLVDNPLGIGDTQAMQMGIEGKWTLTRGHVLAMILNASTNKRYFKNWGVDPDQAMQWLMTVSTKADWDWAQKVWDKIWVDTKIRSGAMYRGITGGTTPEWLPANPIQTPWGVYKGGYYPVLLHKEIKGKSTAALGDMPGILDDHYFSPTAAPPAPHTIERTGTDRPLSLNINDMGVRLRQVIHDTEMRPALIEAGKVLFDSRIQAAFRLYLGDEYADLLKPYLRDVANAPNFRSEWENAFARGSEFMRQNAVFTVVGLNPNTVVKHGLSALIQSFNEIGSTHFADAAKDTWHIPGADSSNWDWAMRTFNELARRKQNWEESLYGQVQDVSATPRGKFMTARDFVMRYSSYPVAYVDLWSAVPTAVGAFRKAKEEGLSDEKAIELGNRAVRFAHGSSSVTNRPAIMRAGPAVQWLTTIYNFYSHMWQKALEIKWRMQDAQTFRKLGDEEKAKETMDVQRFVGMTWAYVLGPAAVGTFVAKMNGEWKEDEPIGEVYAKQVMHNVSGYIPGVRDVVSAFLHGKDPQVGLATTSFLLLYNPFRDLTKNEPFSDEHRGKFIQDLTGAVGQAFGLMPMQVGKWIRAYSDVKHNVQDRDFWPQLMRGHERERR